MSRGVSHLHVTIAAPVTALIVPLVILGAMLLSSTVASAQQSEAEWAFAPLGPFADERVVTALRLQMDAASAGATSGVTLAYHGGVEVDPAQDPRALLEAAGIVPPGGAAPRGLVIERPCRVWAADGTLEASALALGEELVAAWSAYGVNFAPCTLTTDPILADLYVFPPGEPPAALTEVATQGVGSFIGFAPDAPGTATPVETPPPATDVPVIDPVPADGGDGAEEGTDETVAVIVGIVLAVVVLAVGRGISWYRPV